MNRAQCPTTAVSFYLPIWLFVLAVKAGLLALAGGRYGYLSDELYFLDAADRLALGYVDLPPLLPWLMAALPADSVLTLRATAALIGTAAILVGVDLCRVLGGRPAAAWLVALLLLFAPGFLSVQAILTMNVLDQLWWLAAFWLTARYQQTRVGGYVLALGVVLGLGVLTKLSMLAFCVALSVAWLIWDRRVFMRASTWMAAALAILLTLPHLYWQIANDWPLLEFVAAYNATPPNALVLRYPLLGMLLTMNPAYALFWVPGACYVLTASDMALRVLGTAAWLCLAVFVLAGVKFYFAVPVFALFMVTGVLFWQRLLPAGRRVWQVPLAAVAASGVLAVPAAVPVLPAGVLQQVTRFLRDGEQAYPGTESADLERYFPHFAEMHGWPELVQLSTEVWQALSPAEREGAVILASHYGHSGALNQLDAQDRLPEAYGRHMNYHLWSEGLTYERGLFVGFSATELAPLFETVEERGRLACTDCMARERGLIVHYVAGPRLPVAEIRERLQRYDFF